MMGTLTIILLILLAIDSILLIYFTAKQNWRMFVVCLALAGILDLVIVKAG